MPRSGREEVNRASDGINRRLASSFIVGGFVAGLALFFFLVLSPSEFFVFLDRVSIKALLAFVGVGTISWLGILVYVFFHTPPPERLLLLAIRFVILIGFFSGPVTLGTTFSFQTDDLVVDIGSGNAYAALQWIVLASFVALLYLVTLYVFYMKGVCSDAGTDSATD